MALDYFDRLAEASVKDAIQQLVANGTRPSGRNVPPEARLLLSRKTRGRLTESEAEKRVQKAIERLKERKEIRAPKTPNSEWAVLGQEPKATAES
jgi:hypothetical protein